MSFPRVSNLPFTDVMKVSDDNNIHFVHPSLSDDLGREFSIECQYLYQYSSQEIYICNDEVKNPSFLLCDVPGGHGVETLESMYEHCYDYVLGVMTVFFSADDNSPGTRLDDVLTNEHIQKIGRYDYFLLILSSCHLLTSLEICVKQEYISGMCIRLACTLSCIETDAVWNNLRQYCSGK